MSWDPNNPNDILFDKPKPEDCPEAVAAASRVPDEQLVDALKFVETYWVTLRQRTQQEPLGKDPANERVDSACMTYNHDFGLLPEEAKNKVRMQAILWLRAWQKEGLS